MHGSSVALRHHEPSFVGLPKRRRIIHSHAFYVNDTTIPQDLFLSLTLFKKYAAADGRSRRCLAVRWRHRTAARRRYRSRPARRSRFVVVTSTLAAAAMASMVSSTNRSVPRYVDIIIDLSASENYFCWLLYVFGPNLRGMRLWSCSHVYSGWRRGWSCYTRGTVNSLNGWKLSIIQQPCIEQSFSGRFMCVSID